MSSVVTVPVLSVGAFNALRFALITLIIQPLIEFAVGGIYEKAATIHLLQNGTLRWRVARYGPMALHGSYYSRSSRLLLYFIALCILVLVLLVEFDSGAKQVPVHEKKRTVATVNLKDLRSMFGNGSINQVVDQQLTENVLKAASRISSLSLARGGDVDVKSEDLGLMWITSRDEQVDLSAARKLKVNKRYLRADAVRCFQGNAIVETSYDDLVVGLPSRAVMNKHIAPTAHRESARVFIGEWLMKAANNQSFHGRNNAFARVALATKYGGSVVLVKVRKVGGTLFANVRYASIFEADGVSCMATGWGYTEYACMLQERRNDNLCSRELVLGINVQLDSARGRDQQWVALTHLTYIAEETKCLSDLGAYWAHLSSVRRWHDALFGSNYNTEEDTSSLVEVMSEVFSMAVSDNKAFLLSEGESEIEVKLITKPTVGVGFLIGTAGLILLSITGPCLGLTVVGSETLKSILWHRKDLSMPKNVRVNSGIKYVETLIAREGKKDDTWTSSDEKEERAGIILIRGEDEYRIGFGHLDQAERFTEKLPVR